MLSSASPQSSELTLAEAHAAILAAMPVIREQEPCPLSELSGRVLAQDVLAPHPLPLFDNAAMDGYAFHSRELRSDAPTTLRVVGRVLAGHPYPRTLAAGEAVRIMTGAPIPDGADSVVMQEHATCDADTLTLPVGLRAQQHVRPRGEDLAAGAVALKAGQRCSAAEIGLLASLGLQQLAVIRRVRVAVFSTGDELRSPGDTLSTGHIFDSNRFSLISALHTLPCEVIDLGCQPDQPEHLAATLQHAARCADIIVTSGGVSTGDADYMPRLMAQLGSVSFWKLALKPGRPFAFGRLGTAVLFGLPGNPIASLVSFTQLVRDALLHCAGVRDIPPPLRFEARCMERIRKAAGRREFVRAHLDMSTFPLRVYPAATQGSALLKALCEANCFIVLPEEQTDVAVNDWVEVRPLSALL